MGTFALIVMAVGSWVLVIAMIATLGKLYTASNATSHDTAQDGSPDAEKVVYLDGTNNVPAEDHGADAATRAAA